MYSCSSYNENTSGAFETQNFLAISTQSLSLFLLRVNSPHLPKTLTRSHMPLKIQCSSSKAKHKLSDPNHPAILYTCLFTSHGWIGSWAGLLALTEAGRSRTTFPAGQHRRSGILSPQAGKQVLRRPRLLSPSGAHQGSRCRESGRLRLPSLAFSISPWDPAHLTIPASPALTSSPRSSSRPTGAASGEPDAPAQPPRA